MIILYGINNSEIEIYLMRIRRVVIVYGILAWTLFVSGLYIASFGVIIPYYSRASGLDETEYSFTFLVRALAYVLGSVSVKFILSRIPTQKAMLFLCGIISVALFLCSLSISPLNLTIMLFLSGFAIISTNIIVFGQTIKLFEHEQPDFWLVLLGFGFGMGATLSPLFIKYFEIHTYKIFGLLAGIAVPLLLAYPLQDFEEEKKGEQNRNTISTQTEIFICLIMLLFPAQEVGMSGWMPTYSIKAGIAGVETSGLYSTLFWLSNAIFRVVWACWIKGPVNCKLRFILSTISGVSVVLLMLQWAGLYQFVCVLGSVYFGAMLSCIYAFCLAFPADNGFQNTTSNSANFVMAYCIGEGIMPAPLGYIMGLLGYRSLMVVVLVTCLASWWALEKAVLSMRQDKLNNEKDCALLGNCSPSMRLD